MDPVNVPQQTFELANGVKFTLRPPMMDALAWLEEEHGLTPQRMSEGIGFAAGTAALWKCADFEGDAKADLAGFRSQMSPALFREALGVLLGFFQDSEDEAEEGSASTSSEPAESGLGRSGGSPPG